MNSLGAISLILILVLVAFGPRKIALLAVIAGVLFLPQSQTVDVLGLNLFGMRFIEVTGLCRILLRRELASVGSSPLDKVVLLFYLYVPLVYTLRNSTIQASVIAASLDSLFCYFTFRGLLHDFDEFVDFLRMLVFLVVPYVGLVFVESITHRNVFSSMGDMDYDWTRQGRFRCLGSFRNPDLLGSFGTVFLPLYISLTREGKYKSYGLMGIVLSLFLVWASNSGGPVCAAGVSVAGWALWSFRRKMRVVRWIMLGAVLGLALVMKAPVYYIMARLSNFIGGAGWHRSYLMDVAVRHLDQWWLAGMNLQDTSDWFPYTVNSGADITNQFILFGLTGGLPALFLFCYLLKEAFRVVGSCSKQSGPVQESNLFRERVFWGLGVMLAVHIVTWFGVSYFDQFYAVWSLQLAAVASLGASVASEYSKFSSKVLVSGSTAEPATL